MRHASQEGFHIWYCKPGQKPMSGLQYHRAIVEEPTVVMLNGTAVKLSPEYLCLYPQFYVALKMDLRSFLFAMCSG